MQDFLGRILAQRGIGVRMLGIALIPSLVVAMLLSALFVHQKIRDGEAGARDNLSSAARNLASACEYGLASGNQAILQQTVSTIRQLEHLQFVQVMDESNSVRAQSGTLDYPLPSRLPAPGQILEYPNLWLTSALIVLPEIQIEPDPFDNLTDRTKPGKSIGQVLVAIDTKPLKLSRRNTLLIAAGLTLAAMLLTAFIAWRMSRGLTLRIRHISQTVDEIASGRLQSRVQVQPAAELGKLEEGVNRMAHALGVHHAELQTRISEATADLLQKKDEAERANIAKSRFFAAASHDLRQPLHALSLFSEVMSTKLAQHGNPQDLVDLSGQIASSVSSMQTLLNALLDVSKLDANVVEYQPRHFLIAPILERIRQQFGEAARNKGLALRIRMCNCTLFTDPFLLERILLNLVSNAIRYTSSGGVLVACRPRGQTMLIQVWDTGIGIPEESHKSIFQEFVQLNNPERDRSKGLGLGLAIVAGMAELLGAPISLRSQVGRGSVFGVTIPVGIVQQIVQVENQSVSTASLKGRLGVIVDDDEQILSAMQELFNAWDVDLVACRSADEALQQLDELEQPADFLMSDFRLPGNTDGIEVAQLFRQRFGDELPVLILTGDTAPETLQRITQAGLAILHKPVRAARLRAMLTHLLG